MAGPNSPSSSPAPLPAVVAVCFLNPRSSHVQQCAWGSLACVRALPNRSWMQSLIDGCLGFVVCRLHKVQRAKKTALRRALAQRLRKLLPNRAPPERPSAHAILHNVRVGCAQGGACAALTLLFSTGRPRLVGHMTSFRCAMRWPCITSICLAKNSARPRCIAEERFISCAPSYCQSRLLSLTNLAYAHPLHVWKSFHLATPARLLDRGQQGCWWARVASIPGPPPFTRRAANLEGQRTCDTHFPDWCANDSARCTASCNNLDMYPPVECHVGSILLHPHPQILTQRTHSLPTTHATHARAHTARIQPQHLQVLRCLPECHFGTHLAPMVTRLLRCPNSRAPGVAVVRGLAGIQPPRSTPHAHRRCVFLI